jgi:hypothetical protein
MSTTFQETIASPRSGFETMHAVVVHAFDEARGSTVAASLLATVAPALSATRIRPAVALRMTD